MTIRARFDMIHPSLGLSLAWASGNTNTFSFPHSRRNRSKYSIPRISDEFERAATGLDIIDAKSAPYVCLTSCENMMKRRSTPDARWNSSKVDCWRRSKPVSADNATSEPRMPELSRIPPSRRRLHDRPSPSPAIPIAPRPRRAGGITTGKRELIMTAVLTGIITCFVACAKSMVPSDALFPAVPEIGRITK